MVRFQELPVEVVELIISYIPNTELERLFELPIIGKHAVRRYYSTISISDKYEHSEPSWGALKGESLHLLYKGLPDVSVAEYLELRKSNAFISPKLLVFQGANELLKIAKSFPNLLKNTKITLRLQLSKYFNLKHFIEEYNKSPFVVHHMHLTVYGSRKDFLPIQLTRNVSSLFISTGEHHRIIFADYFQNLTSLQTRAKFREIDIDTIPRTIKSLSCCFQCENVDEVELDFPKGLIHLDLALNDQRQNGQENINCYDITQLANLKHLSLAFHIDTRYSPSLWMVPSSIKSLSIDWPTLIHGDLSSSCPQLIKLCITKVQNYTAQNWLDILSLPKTLEILEIPEIFLYRHEDLSKKEMQQLPIGLKSLQTRPIYQTDILMVVDFTMSDFYQLQELHLGFTKPLSILDIPTTLSTLTMYNLSKFDFNELTKLYNLNKLNIKYDLSKTGFSFNLPDSLRTLALENCGLSKINITSPGVIHLHLAWNNFKSIGEDNFVIPNTVRELLLEHNAISKVTRIDSKNLEILRLDSNKLVTVCGLPKNLKKLSLSRNRLGISKKSLVFPKELEHLVLSENEIDIEWLILLNLLECTKLKSLFLNKNNLLSFDTACLPKSLTILDLSSNKIKTLVGDFSNTNLAKLYLQHNHLRNSFSNRKEQKVFFGSSIRFVDVTYNHLLKYDVAGILDDLSNKPKFDILNVEQRLCVDLPDPYKEQARKVRKLNH